MFRLEDLNMDGYDYSDWLDHFTRNERTRLKNSFSDKDILTDKQCKEFFPSIREFSKGESSDGKFLMKTVRQFAKRNDQPKCEVVFIKFIAEENMHSNYLKQFMDHNNIPEMRRSVLDNVFRRMRTAGGFQGEIIVLVTAEIIALSYYRALAARTDSPALKAICSQMLHDELPHIVFQSYNLSFFASDYTELRRLIMDGATMAEWTAHQNVYKAGGYTLKKLIRENHGYLRQSEKLIRKIKAHRHTVLIETPAVSNI